MKVLGYLFGALLVILGLLFCISAGSSGVWQRWILGGVLFGAGLSVFYFIRMKVPDTKVEVTQNVRLSGDVSLEQLKCNNCGATLDEKSVSVQAGAVFVKCPYCDTTYQIEEAPKW